MKKTANIHTLEGCIKVDGYAYIASSPTLNLFGPEFSSDDSGDGPHSTSTSNKRTASENGPAGTPPRDKKIHSVCSSKNAIKKTNEALEDKQRYREEGM